VFAVRRQFRMRFTAVLFWVTLPGISSGRRFACGFTRPAKIVRQFWSLHCNDQN
jgi:hypothetical protein